MHTRRSFGLTCDHLIRIKMVDGTGAIRDSKEEPALLWSARGGGNGHFGIVAELTFNTRAAPHNFHHGSFVPTNWIRNAPRRYWRPGSKLLLICLTRFFQAWIVNGSEVTVVSSLLVRASKNGW